MYSNYNILQEEGEGGYCLGHEATGAICLQGSTLADKLPAAFGACFGDRRGKGGKGGKRGKGGKKGGNQGDNVCHSFDDIMQWVEEVCAIMT